MRLNLALFVPLAVLFSDVSGFVGLHSRKTREPVEIIPRSRHIVLSERIEQLVDHFNPTDNRTWEMRYYYNDEHFTPGGAIVIFMGGEWEIQSITLQGGQAYDIAKQHHGYLFYTEHRYYGDSYPTPNAATENLQYLSVDQALADLAYFVKYVKKTIPGLSDSKVVIIGGSYAGTMAVWFRMKYPHLVDVALSSGAPLVAVADYYQYYEVLGKALISKGGQKCYDIVQKGMEQLQQEINGRGGAKVIAKLFNLCSPIDPKSPLDFGSLLSGISGPFAGIVQYSKPGDIEEVCDFLKDKAANNTELFALAKFITSRWGRQCADMEYKTAVKAFQGIRWGSDSTAGSMRQWFYQTCTEFGLYQTHTSKDQPFFNEVNNLDMFLNLCKDIYELDFTNNAREISEAGIKRSNLLYGALRPAVTRVISVYGTIDPWHSLGILEDINEHSSTIVIQGASHCADLYASTPADSAELIAARKRVLDLIKEWLQ